jgi:hypothetical protein
MTGMTESAIGDGAEHKCAPERQPVCAGDRFSCTMGTVGPGEAAATAGAALGSAGHMQLPGELGSTNGKLMIVSPNINNSVKTQLNSCIVLCLWPARPYTAPLL